MKPMPKIHGRMMVAFAALLLSVSLACFALPVPGTGNAALPLPPTGTPVREAVVTATAVTPTPHPHCVVNTTALNLRACAGTHCTAQAWLHEGEVLTILEREDQWIKVETQNRDTGWVHSKFCSGE